AQPSAHHDGIPLRTPWLSETLRRAAAGLHHAVRDGGPVGAYRRLADPHRAFHTPCRVPPFGADGRGLLDRPCASRSVAYRQRRRVGSAVLLHLLVPFRTRRRKLVRRSASRGTKRLEIQKPVAKLFSTGMRWPRGENTTLGFDN